MCNDLAIPLIPGRHCPMNTNLNAIITPAPSTYTDNESFISMGTTLSNATKPMARSKIYYDDPKPLKSDGGANTYTMDFPSLDGGRNTKKKPASSPSSQRQKATRNLNDSDDNESVDFGGMNPWNSRSRNIPRQPDTSHFDIEFTKDEDLNSDADDYNSVASFGRGRGSLVNASLSSSVVSSYGRGRPFRP